MLQTFRAKDMREALSVMRTAFGEDAIILSSEKTGDGNVLLCADSGEAETSTAKQESVACFETRYRDRLLVQLRVKSQATAAPHVSFSRADLLANLAWHRTPDSLAHALAEAAEASGFDDPQLALASALDKRMSVSPIDMRDGHAILLIGPHGAGKTAVAAKLAAEAQMTGRKVQLAATDLKSAGQRERLETFAMHLDIPVIDASSPRLLSEAVAEARKSGSILIADSAGHDPRDPPHDVLVATRLGIIEPIGVMSVAMDAEEASEIAAALAALGIKRLVLTGLDVARRKGAACMLACSGLAIAQVTASAYLVEGLDSLTPPGLARSLLSPMDSAIPKG